MLELTEEQKNRYYHRSYTAVDGLWFMKLEEKYGFDAALDIDSEVWKVMPKIQARCLKSIAGTGEGMEALFECFTAKLALDGLVFSTERRGKDFSIAVSECNWYNLLLKSNREHVARQLGTRICLPEATMWASEFGENIEFSLEQQICLGNAHCVFRFTDKNTGK